MTLFDRYLDAKQRGDERLASTLILEIDAAVAASDPVIQSANVRIDTDDLSRIVSPDATPFLGQLFAGIGDLVQRDEADDFFIPSAA